MTGLSWKLSYGFQLEEEGRWDGLFHTRVVVQERSCAMTIDHMSLINAASIEMVEKLDLPMTPRAQPYLFRWGHEELSVTHQTKVPFLLGNFLCTVLCDVIPVPMVSCHLLLGKPWYKEHDVAYDCQTHVYTVKKGKKYDLVPMGQNHFIAWRREHQKKIKEEEDAKKNMVEATEISMITIQSVHENIVIKIESKLRTVSVQEGEDDATQCNINSEVFDVSPEAGNVQKYTACTPDYIRPSHEDEHALVNGMVMQTDVLETTCIDEEKKGVQFEIKCHRIRRACGGNQGKEHPNYFGKPRLEDGMKESTSHRECFLGRIIYYARIKTRRLFTFIFLSRKEKINMRILFIWELFSLKDVGWGPPQTGKKPHQN